MTRKQSSKEAYRAFTAENIQTYVWFISLPLPLGVSGLNISILINVYETGFYVKSASLKYRKGHTSCRVRQPSHYTGSEPKVNGILVINPGNPNLGAWEDTSCDNPRHWIMEIQENCNQYVFGDFINNMLSNIEDRPVTGGHDNKRCIIWDNLSLHKLAYATTLIYECPSKPLHCRWLPNLQASNRSYRIYLLPIGIRVMS